MKTEELTQLRKLLPHRYARMISENLKGITTDQVRGVFGGLIHNPDVIEVVVEEAKKVVIRLRKIESGIREVIEQN